MLKKRKKQIKAIFILSGIGIFSIFFCVLLLRLHGGSVVRAKGEDLLLKEAVAYRQDDMRWADDRLGDSAFTMKSSGCLVSCIASAVSMQTDEEITPGELNRIFSEKHVYDGEGNIQWTAIRQVPGYSAEVFADVSGTEIEECLEAGNYPIVRVRVKGVGSFHYVLLVGRQDGEYLCMDPLEDNVTKLSDYGNRVYAVRLVCRYE